jgi:AraC-like DNA-binding protein
MIGKEITVSLRASEIVEKYQRELDKHIDDLRKGRAERTCTIQDFADRLHVHPTHLSNTLHQTLRQSPCDIYENKLLALSKELLSTTNQSIGNIARQLHYDPSNFTKFFKAYTGITPKQYRQRLRSEVKF